MPPSVTPESQEATLIQDFSLIPDPQERLTAIVHSCSGEGIPPEERLEADLVPGCVSRVWLTGALEDGSLRLRWDADSPLVRGLAGLICRVYAGSEPAGAAGHRSRILSSLGLDRQISPTRLRGLAAVEARIHGILSPPPP